jgi:hypothetical protein
MSAYSEKARVPVFDGKPENFDPWKIQCNTVVEVEGIRGVLEDALNGDMSDDSNNVIPDMALYTNGGKAKAKAVKDSRKCIT